MRKRWFIILLTGAMAVGAMADEAPRRSTAELAALIAEAEVGSTIVAPPGVYEGQLRITKSITLDGAGGATIDGGGEGTVVEILAPHVTFRGFTVRGSGRSVNGEPAGIRAETGPAVIEDNHLEDVLYGIDLRTSPDSRIRRNTVVGKDLEPGRRGDGIRLWWSVDCIVEDNIVRLSRDMVFWYSERLTVRRNRVTESRYGLHFMYSHDTIVTENDLERNSVGVYLMYSNGLTLTNNTLAQNRGPSGYGLGLKDCDDIVVSGNRVLANRVGVYVDNTPTNVGSVGDVHDNLIAYNEIGVLMTPNTVGNVIVGNGFVDNEEQVAVHGRGALENNAFSTDESGNYWSDYAGFDADGDGVGDLPYAATSLFESLLAREPNLRLFVHSPAQQAVEFTARALPAIRPAPKFTDERPLMAPPQVEGAVVEAPGRWGMILVSVGLLGASGLCLTVAAFGWRPGGLRTHGRGVS